MCGRYALTDEPALIAALFGLRALPELAPRFNIAPTQSAPVVRQLAGETDRRLDLLRWGLVPAGAKDLELGARTVNARAETLAQRSAFRDAYRHRRCLVPASGFFEWTGHRGVRQPFYLRRRDGQPLALAGLWERWRGPGGRDPAVETFTVITTDANAVVAPVHDRMPVVLEPEHFAAWLDPATSDVKTLGALLVPAADDLLEAVPVSRRVNNVAHDDPACLEEVSLPDEEEGDAHEGRGGGGGAQGRLFGD